MYENANSINSNSNPTKKVIQKKENDTGIPAPMKMKFEGMSGLSFDDVKVHYNSLKPAQFHALAFTQGNQVFVGPGQEKHLGHELGHVVQQKQGKVLPTGKIQNNNVNTDIKLEQEADKLSEGTLQMKSISTETSDATQIMPENLMQLKTIGVPQNNRFINSLFTVNFAIDAYQVILDDIPVTFTLHKTNIDNLAQTFTISSIDCLIDNGNIDDIQILFKNMAMVQRLVFNQYVSNPFPDDIVLPFHYNMQIFGQIYDQEVLYSNSAAGYISETNYQGIITYWNARNEESTLPNPTKTGKTKQVIKYGGAHIFNTDTPWTNNVGKDGDNDSKLTAEQARFEILMQDQEPLMDNVNYILYDQVTDQIVIVNALNLTANLHTIADMHGVDTMKMKLPCSYSDVLNAVKGGHWGPNHKAPSLLHAQLMRDLFLDYNKNDSTMLTDVHKRKTFTGIYAIIGNQFMTSEKLFNAYDNYIERQPKELQKNIKKFDIKTLIRILKTDKIENRLMNEDFTPLTLCYLLPLISNELLYKHNVATGRMVVPTWSSFKL